MFEFDVTYNLVLKLENLDDAPRSCDDMFYIGG